MVEMKLLKYAFLGCAFIAFSDGKYDDSGRRGIRRREDRNRVSNHNVVCNMKFRGSCSVESSIYAQL